MMRSLVLCVAVALPAAVARPARAQAPAAPRTPAPGETATPQLVTVRPREQVRFDAQLVVPTYYDRSFWPAIRAGVRLVAPSPARPPVSTAVSAPPVRARPAGARPPR